MVEIILKLTTADKYRKELSRGSIVPVNCKYTYNTIIQTFFSTVKIFLDGVKLLVGIRCFFFFTNLSKALDIVP